jgi:hypothetical protein
VAVEVVGVAVEVEVEVEAEAWPAVGSEVSREEEGAWCRDGGPPEAPGGGGEGRGRGGRMVRREDSGRMESCGSRRDALRVWYTTGSSFPCDVLCVL